jgi:hypothetical protein
MKTRDIYRTMIREDYVWATFRLPYGKDTRCHIIMVGHTESLLRTVSGHEYKTSNTNIQAKEPANVE